LKDGSQGSIQGSQYSNYLVGWMVAV